MRSENDEILVKGREKKGEKKREHLPSDIGKIRKEDREGEDT